MNRNSYTDVLSGSIRGLILGIACMLLAGGTEAQITPEFAKNTGTNPNNTLTWGISSRRSQQMYRTGDFLPPTVPGKIHKVYFMYGSTGNTAPTTYTNLVVSLGQTADTVFPGTDFYTGLTTVFSDPAYVIPAGMTGTWFEIPLQVPFSYDTSLSLIVEIAYDTVTNPDNSTGLGTYNGGNRAGRKLVTKDLSATTGTAQSAFPNFGVEIISQTRNAGISHLTAPVNFCPGNHDVSVEVRNNGNSRIDNLVIDWEMDGVPQPQVNYAVPIDTLGSAGGNRAVVTLGNMLFTANPHTIRAWITRSDGQPETMTADDTLGIGVHASLSGTYTVNSALPTSGNNFSSFTEMADILNTYGVCGPLTVNVAPNSGPYTERLTLNNIPGSSAANRILINGNGNILQDTSTVRQLVTLERTAYVRLDSMLFKSVRHDYISGIFITDESHHDSVTNCVFDFTSIDNSSSGNYAIAFTASTATATSAGRNGSHCYIAGNRILCDGDSTGVAHGISVAGASDSNIIINNTITNTYSYGIYINGATGTLVSGNEIHRSTKSRSIGSFHAVYTTGDVPGTKILNNRIHDPVGPSPSASITSAYYGIRLAGSGTAADPVTVANNVVYNINQGNTAYGIYVNGGAYNRIYHNTVAFNKAFDAGGPHVGIYADKTNPGTEFKNNVISITEGGTGDKYGFYYVAPSDSAVPDAAYNVVYVHSSRPGEQYYGYYNDKAYADRTSFRAAYPGVETISSDADPQFVNPASGNLLPGNNALQGTGYDLTAAVPQDISGITRMKAPTPGAYELAAAVGANARVAARVSPEGYFCNGSQEIRVILQNSGTTGISSMQVQWSLDGVAQTPYTYAGPLDAPGSGADGLDTVTLGNVTIPSGVSTLKVWTVLAGDVNNANDTLTETLHTALSGNYTVNSAAPTGGTNFRTFGDLSQAMYQTGVCGPVVVDVAPGSGPYNEAVTFYNNPGSGPANPVRINGNGNMLQYATSTSSGGIRQLLTFSGTKHLRLDSMVLHVASNVGWGTLLTAGARYDSITNCRYDMTDVTATSSGNGTGIAFSAATNNATSSGDNGSHCYIAGNHIQGPVTAGGPYYGVSVASGGNDSNIIAGNVFENTYYYGVYINAAAGTLVQGNEIHRKDKQSASTFYGIYTIGSSPGTQILGNRVHSAVTDTVKPINYAFRGIHIGGSGTSSSPVLVANNAVYNINQGGTSTTQGIYIDGMSYASVYHNTVAFNKPYTGTGANTGIYATGTLSGVAVKNNLVSISGGGTGAKYGFYYASAATVNGIDAQRNNFYVASTQSGTQYYGYAAGGYTSQAAFQADYPALEAGSLTADPQFVNVAAGNLLPFNMSLQGNGVNLSADVPDDITGAARSAVPTPGAYEIPVGAGYNAGADALVSPGRLFCAGQQEIRVAVLNAGTYPITSMQVQWTLNGAAQTPYTYSGYLDVPGSAAGNRDTITLGTVTVPAGTSTLQVRTAVVNDVNTANDTLTVTLTPSVFRLYAGADTVCSGSGAQLRLDPEAGYDAGMLQWESSPDGITFTPLAGTDSTAYATPSLSNSAWYRVHIASGVNGCYSDTLPVRVVNPQLASVNGSTRCGTGTATLSATASPGSTVKWYANATGGAPIATGNSFTTPVVTGNTTFYAAAALGNGGSFYVGPQNPAAVGSSTSTNGLTAWVVYFTVHTTTVLESVDIFPTAASMGKSSAIRIVNMANSAIVRDAPYTVTTTGTPTSGQTVRINQKLEPGNYSMGLADNVVTLIINNKDAVYPYASDALSITGHNFSSNYYYWFFYNWKVGYGCESPRQAVNVTVTAPPAVTVSASAPAICAGDTVTLTASSANAGYTYNWQPGNVTGSQVSFAPVTATTYYVTATDNSGGTHNGCVLTDSIRIPVNAVPPAAITVNGTTTFCAGGSVTLTANAGVGYSYQWYRDGAAILNAGNSTYTADSSGSYTVKVTGGNQCFAISQAITVTVHPAPVPVITESGGTLSTGNYTNYQWRRDGTPIPGATGRSHTPAEPGDYTVTVTDDNDCAGTSAVHEVPPTGVTEIAGSRQVKIYPNPARDIVYIEAPAAVRVTVSSADGKILLYRENVQSIHIGDLADGVYLIRVHDTKGALLKTERLTKFSR